MYTLIHVQRDQQFDECKQSLKGREDLMVLIGVMLVALELTQMQQKIQKGQAAKGSLPGSSEGDLVKGSAAHSQASLLHAHTMLKELCD